MPVTTASTPAIRYVEQQKRAPCRERDQEVGDQKRHQIGLDLPVDLVQYFDRHAPSRERCAGYLRDLAPKRVARSKQKQREQQRDEEFCDHAQRLARLLLDEILELRRDPGCA